MMYHATKTFRRGGDDLHRAQQQHRRARRRGRRLVQFAVAILAGLLLGHAATKAFGQVVHDRLHIADRAPW